VRQRPAINAFPVPPKSASDPLHPVYDQPNADSVAGQYDRIVDGLVRQATVADQLENARTDLLAFTAFRKQIWRQIWAYNP
jgi:putative transposase